MTFTTYVSVIVAVVLCWIFVSKLRKHHRDKAYSQPLKEEWIEILCKNVYLYSLLPNELKTALHGHVNYFLDDKEFVGCNGQEITDEIRVTIAGNACLLVLKRNATIFPGFKTILVYPDTYVAKQVTYDGLVVVNEDSTRAGESWHRGPIVLSWADVSHGASNIYDGHNVVLHEFAHKLDEENEIMDGLPILRERSHYAEWSKVLNQEYDAFLKRVSQRENSVIDEYGAVSPTEFFAVVTEAFFEKSIQMRKKLPELYSQLVRFYDLDPATWHAD